MSNASSDDVSDNGFTKLGKSFQEKCLQALIVDHVWATQFIEVFNVDECFEPAYLKLLANKYIGHHTKHKEFPSIELLMTIVRDELSSNNDLILREQITSYLKKVVGNLDLGDLPWVKDKAFTFCRQQVLKKALAKSCDVILTEKYETVVDIMKSAISAGIPNSPGHDYKNDLDARYSLTARNVIATGIPELDQKSILNGGLGSGEIGIVISPTGVGKSHALVQLGAAGLQQGKTVFHYTLELNERLVGIRYDSHLTNIPATDCWDHKEVIRDYFTENESKLGRLIIKEYPTRTITITTLRSHIEKLSFMGIVPDLIIVDYAGIMRSTEKYDLPRFELQCIIQELRGFGREMGVPLWTALQSNKEGAKGEIIDLTNASEGYGQAMEADLVLGLQRPSALKSTGMGSMFIAKNRAGMDGILFRIHLDTSRSKLRIVSDSDYADGIANVHGADEDAIPESTMEVFRTQIRKNKNMFGKPGT